MPEQQNIEYKSSWHDDYLKWICGFANAQGGVIYIGKNDIGNIIGVADYKSLMDEIPNKIKNNLGITAEVNLLQDGEKNYIEIIFGKIFFNKGHNRLCLSVLTFQDTY